MGLTYRIALIHHFKQMLLQIAGKQAGYRAMAEFYQSLVCKNNKSIGEEIARLEVTAVAPKLFNLNSCFQCL